jgi:hypothetical protein
LLSNSTTCNHYTAGVAPRCWSDNDDFDVQEEAPEGWGNDVIH